MSIYPSARTRGTAYILPLLALVVATGCEPHHESAAAAQRPAAAAAAYALEDRPAYVDSVRPVDEQIRRFKAAIRDSATVLTGGAASADELIALFMAALEANDLQTLLTLALTPAEFIDLYYPHTRFTAPPYELAPDLVWFQIGNYGSKGLNRALARFGGRRLEAGRHDCATDVVEGPNRLVGGCVINIGDAAGGRTTVSLFGTMLQRDGRWKFINYANRL